MTKTDKKAIFLDIDGTLSQREAAPCAEDVAALRAARAAGHYVFINTGRARGMLPPVLVGVDYLDGYLCGCGTTLILDDKVVFTAEVPRPLLREAIAFYQKSPVNRCLFEAEDGVYMLANDPARKIWTRAKLIRSPEDFETANAYLAAKYYETLRERYAESGYPVLDHRITWVVLNRYFALDNDQGRDLIFAEASISCAYTEPGMETPQEYTRNAELILEKTGEAQFKVLGFNSIGAAWELQDAVNKSGMSPEEKIRYIDAHIRDAALNDGLLPMSNK